MSQTTEQQQVKAKILNILQLLQEQCIDILVQNTDGYYYGDIQPDIEMKNHFEETKEQIVELFGDKEKSDETDHENDERGWNEYYNAIRQ